ncbi:MAG: hypothetical protein QOG64_2883 [Acidimicrobiaceae bacterium]|nr:hypothetical protein [Acidimicrobiaceae bacterium]
MPPPVPPVAASDASDVIEFDLHGIVGVRAIGAMPADAAALARQLGPTAAPLDRAPDIVIRYVDRLAVSGTVQLLGLNDAGFTDDAFLVLGADYRAKPRTQIALQQVGGTVEMVCEHHVGAVPLLTAVANLTALAKGVLPLHGAAFEHRGIGVVTTGWSKGGKTESLLAFTAHGARYVGDEWIYLIDQGAQVRGFPEPITAWDWQLREVPRYRASLPRGTRARLSVITRFESLEPVVPQRVFRRVMPFLKNRHNADLDPRVLFGSAATDPKCSFDRLFYVASHESPAITVDPIGGDEVAARMTYSLRFERLRFMDYYLKFRFAFPDLASPLVEEADDFERNLLKVALAGKPTYVVRHPYPCSLDALYEAMRPFCD